MSPPMSGRTELVPTLPRDVRRTRPTTTATTTTADRTRRTRWGERLMTTSLEASAPGPVRAGSAGRRGQPVAGLFGLSATTTAVLRALAAEFMEPNVLVQAVTLAVDGSDVSSRHWLA